MRFLLQRQNGDIGFPLCLFLEGDRSVNQCENRMVFSQTNIVSRFVKRTALADDDIAGFGELAAVNLYTQSFAFGFTTVLRTTYTFFVCHIFLF